MPQKLQSYIPKRVVMSEWRWITLGDNLETLRSMLANLSRRQDQRTTLVEEGPKLSDKTCRWPYIKSILRIIIRYVLWAKWWHSSLPGNGPNTQFAFESRCLALVIPLLPRLRLRLLSASKPLLKIHIKIEICRVHNGDGLKQHA